MVLVKAVGLLYWSRINSISKLQCVLYIFIMSLEPLITIVFQIILFYFAAIDLLFMLQCTSQKFISFYDQHTTY